MLTSPASGLSPRRGTVSHAPFQVNCSLLRMYETTSAPKSVPCLGPLGPRRPPCWDLPGFGNEEGHLKLRHSDRPFALSSTFHPPSRSATHSMPPRYQPRSKRARAASSPLCDAGARTRVQVATPPPTVKDVTDLTPVHVARLEGFFERDWMLRAVSREDRREYLRGIPPAVLRAWWSKR